LVSSFILSLVSTENRPQDGVKVGAAILAASPVESRRKARNGGNGFDRQQVGGVGQIFGSHFRGK
jgi:hypothetical protein